MSSSSSRMPHLQRSSVWLQQQQQQQQGPLAWLDLLPLVQLWAQAPVVKLHHRPSPGRVSSSSQRAAHAGASGFSSQKNLRAMSRLRTLWRMR
jgi:hypothetical protein